MSCVRGVGIYVDGKYSVRYEGKYTKEYCLWQNILRRCYSKVFKDKYPTYLDCTVSENFKHFQYFAEWCNNQTGFGLEGFQIDKDILAKQNKAYSEDTCVFVPRRINMLLVDRAASRGEYPIGTHYCERHGKFIAQMSKNGKNKKLGSHDTQIEAQVAYKLAKEAYVKEVVEEYKNSIDIRVYDTLMKWEINFE
jgi:hypothetical protein